MKIKLFFSTIVLISGIFLSTGIQSSENVSFTPIRIAKTGQTTCHNLKGKIIPCAGTGQDGEYQKGTVWPKPRFIINRNGTITDRLTGLMWERTPDTTTVVWEDAFKRIDRLNKIKLGGYKDWRLPNINELLSLVNFGVQNKEDWLKKQGFNFLFKKKSYLFISHLWSSSTYQPNERSALILRIDDGRIITNEKTEKHMPHSFTTKGGFFYYVIGVRIGEPGVIKLVKTGQTKKFFDADDGDLQIGAPIPEPRFKDNENETMTDKLTGLIWEKRPIKNKLDYKNAFDRIKELNKNKLGGYSDWRVPNINELRSLNNLEGIADNKMNEQGFIGVMDSGYWSSTNYNLLDVQNSFSASDAFSSDLDGFWLSNTQKDEKLYVIAVRGGE